MSVSREKFSITTWLVLIIASIGFAFDIYELLMLPLIIKPMIASMSFPLVQSLVAGGMGQSEAEALWAPGGVNYVNWARLLFFVPSIAGGIFGLLGGYLTDRFGRRRVLTFSILLYAFAAFAAGYATSLPQLLLLRSLVFIGVCVEFVAAVAWLAELFPEPKRREKVLGYTQAFSSLGGVLVAGANYYAAGHAASFPAIYGGHEAWRYTLMSGVLPALPLILIRPFLPESPGWLGRKSAGQLKRPSIAALFAPGLRRTTVTTTFMFAASYGIAFGAIQQLPQILAWPRGHVDIKKEAGRVGEAAAAAFTNKLADEGKSAPSAGLLKRVQREASGNRSDEMTSAISSKQELGGLLGRVLLAVLALVIVSRRQLLRLFLVPALVCVPAYFYVLSGKLDEAGNLSFVGWGIFLCGVLTVAQFSFWGNYIPRVFPIHLRGTGEGFAANIGGRILGTSAAFVTLSLSAGGTAQDMARSAACVAGAFALMGVIFSFWLPEPREGEFDSDG